MDKLLVYVPNAGRVWTVEEGAHNLLWASGTLREGVERGRFYNEVGVLSRMESKASRDPALAGRLWELDKGGAEAGSGIRGLARIGARVRVVSW